MTVDEVLMARLLDDEALMALVPVENIHPIMLPMADEQFDAEEHLPAIVTRLVGVAEDSVCVGGTQFSGTYMVMVFGRYGLDAITVGNRVYELFEHWQSGDVTTKLEGMGDDFDEPLHVPMRIFSFNVTFQIS